MKNLYTGMLTLVLALAALPVIAGTPSNDQKPAWQYPVIQNAGGVVPLPDAALHPDADKTYKVVFNLTKNDDPAKVNKGLEHVARAVNLFGMSGVGADQRQFVVVLHGKATVLAGTAEAYQAFTGKKDPNIKLIHALTQAGVEFYVCGQALAEHNIPHSAVNADVKLSLSAISDLIILQKQGYVLYPL
ncbi:MAG TPA: DsrE family protein [Gammaproteobacteria bacterium]|nr:DsrE family protein [Gammaproteobacteria bacterium]